jgi:EmrB/QacA subfamily drug resistance transporter
MQLTRGYRNRWIALGFMGISLLVISMDDTVLNLALPSIANDLRSTASQLQWMIDAYILVIAGLLLTMGYIGDRIGRKTLLQVGLVIFAVFSLGAALSNSNGTLIAMRALMGIGAAIILPATLSILTATFRDSRERAQAIAIWSAVFALGIGIGPLIGGYLLDNFHWSSVFYINIPVVAIGIIGGQYFIENSRAENARKIDVPGAVLSTVGFFALVYAIIQAGMDGWTAGPVLYAFGAAVVLLSIFIYWELKSMNSMLPLDFFRNMSFTGANVALTLVSFAMMGALFFLSQFLQSVQNYTPLEAGVRLLPIAGVTFVFTVLSARVAGYIGTKFTVGIGIIISASGFFYFAHISAVNTSYDSIVVGMSIASLGMGLTISPATNSIMGSIPVSRAGIGSAMNNTTRMIGGALGIAILGTLLNSNYIARINAVDWPVSIPAQALEIIRGSIQGAHIVAQSIGNPQLAKFIIDTADKAFASSITSALVVAGIIMVAASVITLAILPSQIKASEEKNTAAA